MRWAFLLALFGVVACEPGDEQRPSGVPSELAGAVEAASVLGIAPPGHEMAPRLHWRIEVDGNSVNEVLVLAGDRGVRGRFEPRPAHPNSVDPIALTIIPPPSAGRPVRDVVASISAAVHARVDQRRVVQRVESSVTWDTGVGDCTEIADLTAAAIRGLGIDARVVGGAAPFNGEMRAHAWVEYDDGGTWIGIDPTWEQFPLGAGYVPLDRGAQTADLEYLESIGGRVSVVAL